MINHTCTVHQISHKENIKLFLLIVMKSVVNSSDKLSMAVSVQAEQ